MIEQNVENEARPEAARRRGACHAERKNEPLVPGIGRRAAVCGAGRRGTLGSGDRPRAVFTEAFGWFPQYLPAVVLCVCIALDGARSMPLRAAGGLLAVAGSGILLYMGAHHLVKRGMSGPSITLWTVLLGGLSLGICALALYRSRSGGRKKLEFVCLWGTVYLLAGLAAINIIKAVWQRTRFDDMLTAAGGGFEGAFAQFTSWMQPFGNGGSSFPSGHTAAACSVFILTLACDVCLKWNRRRTLVWALCWAYVAFMALCRLVIGRHYLSDTLAAAFVMLLLYLGMRKTKWYRAGARELTAPGT